MRLPMLLVATAQLLACNDRRKSTADPVATPEPAETNVTIAAPSPSPTPTPSAAPAPIPNGTVTIGRVTSDVPIPAAELVVGSFAQDFSRCYETTLQRTPTANGRMDVVLSVEPTGTVVGAPRVEGGVGLPPELGSCIAKTIGAARFRGFAGRRATLRVPLVLALARDGGATAK